MYASDCIPRLSVADDSKKRKLTETEIALRRSETARRRRNQSEKKLEDDKIEVSGSDPVGTFLVFLVFLVFFVFLVFLLARC